MPIDTKPLMATIAAQVETLTDAQAQEVMIKCATYEANARARKAKERAAKVLLAALFGDDVVALPVERYGEAASRHLLGEFAEDE